MLGTTANGDCAVQDFYADSNTKKNEPFIIDAHHSCGKLNSGAYDDAMITYDEKQQIDGIAHYKDGETLNILISDGDGHLMYADFSDKNKTTVTMKVYDDNLLSMVFHNDEIAELTIFGNNGVTTLIRYVNGKGDVANSYVWDKGEKVPFNNQEVLDSLTEDMMNSVILPVGKALQAYKPL